MNIDQLRMFLEVSEYGSFQQVAERNLLSQRAVSKKMKRLEEEVGARLFERKQNKIELTNAGILFAQRCRTILRLVQETATDLKQVNTTKLPTLSIGYLSPFDAVLVRRGLRNMNKKVNPLIREEGVEHLIADVLIGDLDCAFILDHYGFDQKLSQAGLSSLVVDRDEMLIGVSDKLVHGQQSLSEHFIRQMPVLYYSNEDSDYLRRAFIASLGKLGEHISVNRVYSFEQMQMLVSLGKAIAFYPGELLGDLMQEEEHIKYLPLDSSTNQSFVYKLIYEGSNRKLALKEYINAYPTNSGRNK